MELFSFFNFKPLQIEGIINVLAAILHLKYSLVTQGTAAKSGFIHLENAEVAASLLGVSFEHLANTIFKGLDSTKGNLPTSKIIR